MSVRFKYAGDKDISAGRSGGASIFSLPGPISFPEAGTILETLYTQEYPLAEGGNGVSVLGSSYPSQTADVYRKADGTGGNYLDWANAFNVNFKSYGSYITNESGTTSVNINGTDYSTGTYETQYYHDGSGWYYASGSSSYSNSGGLITTDNISGGNYISTPVGSFYYESWSGYSYYHDGSGGYYSEMNDFVQQSDGTFIGTDSTGGTNSTEVPSGSGNYFTYGSWSSIDYYYQLSGNTYSYYYQGVMSTNYGDYITYDGTYNYYWDGTGGYYYY
jgi:hypothetical protein